MNRDQDSQYTLQDRTFDGSQVALLERDPQLEGDTLVDTLFQPSTPPAQQKASQDRTTEDFAPASTRSSGQLVALAGALIVVTIALALSLLYLAESRSANYPQTLTELLTPLLHLPLVRIALISILVIVGGSMLFFIGLALSIVSALIHPKKSDSFVPVTAFALGIPAEEIQFPPLLGDYQVNGLFIPRQGATTTIIICPGYRRTYGDVLGMSKHLWLAEHNVLVFEYYGHGSVIGVPITLGYREINDFLGAVEYAKKRVPSAQLGALGYSMGGAVTIMGSARSQEVKAVIADSAFATHWSGVEVAIHRTLRFSSHWPRSIIGLLHWITDQILWLRAGYRFNQVEPLQDIKKLAPRPILLIHGLNDTTVDPGDAQLLYQAAGKPKALWLLPNTEHIKAYFTDSPAYVARVTDFFDQRLKGIQLQENTQPSTEAEPLRIQHTQDIALVHPKPEKAMERRQDQSSQRSIVVLMGKWRWWFPWSSRSMRIDVDASSNLPQSTSVTTPTLPERSTAQQMLNAEQKRDWSHQVAVEQSLICIFAQIMHLPVEQVKASSDFFQLGGDADTLSVLLSAIEQHCQVRLTPSDVFDHPVLFRLAAVVDKRRAVVQQSVEVYA